ncbi:DinB family protein [Lutimaribacter marinistellae]|uniref:DinB family protein n=1 Tax=Lutimaribacter marinistellae TaxID=1820329 RepID=A0ABV7TPI5_9RHOB
MISASYVRMMAAYNRWQNGQLTECFLSLPDVELRRERGAYFGSILGTANHLLWGDLMWMSRFDGGDKPAGGITGSEALCADLVDWQSARKDMDARIVAWADGLSDERLAGTLTWFSGAAGHEVTKPLGMLVVHMYNHQTHHHGQIHKMLTEADAKAPVSDLFFMPEDA